MDDDDAFLYGSDTENIDLKEANNLEPNVDAIKTDENTINPSSKEIALHESKNDEME
ncbi:hypothetical protein JL09_g5517, partial [Pichia kudriavzevii]